MLTRSKYTEQELNSGQLEYGSDNHIREQGKLIDSVFIPAGVLAFKNMDLRESDYNLFQSLDRVVTKKVKTYYVENIESKHKVIINGDLKEKYDITSIDSDAEHKFLYIYLERVRT